MGNACAKHNYLCRPTCHGPLTFHPGAVGEKITLSHGNCRASRELETFKDGLVFSSRPVKIREKVEFRVERSLLAWVGAVRVGFTNVNPTRGPLLPLAIPYLTELCGYWAMPVPHEYCLPGTTVSLWMDPTGKLCFKTSTGIFDCQQTDLDLTQPLWAIIDVYGQSTTVCLLRTVRRNSLMVKKSCPNPPSTFTCGYEDTPPKLKKKIKMCDKESKRCQQDENNPRTSECSQENLCSVCLVHKACLALRCGHRCLCLPCANRVITEFGTCPLCRQSI